MPDPLTEMELRALLPPYSYCRTCRYTNIVVMNPVENDPSVPGAIKGGFRLGCIFSGQYKYCESINRFYLAYECSDWKIDEDAVATLGTRLSY